jgi:hypothetical protein
VLNIVTQFSHSIDSSILRIPMPRHPGTGKLSLEME